MSIKEKTEITIFSYTDYRLFLRDYYEVKKKETPYFSYRYFSKQAGFTSPNYLKLIMDGERNLGGDAINKFSKALKLSLKEARFFRLLVLMNQATNNEEKDFYTKQILKSKSFKALKPLNEAQYDYYSQWYHIPLRELMARPDFKNDPSWVAQQFLPPLTEKQVREGMATLLKLGLIEETSPGRFRQTDLVLHSSDAVTTLGVSNFHREMIVKGAEAIDRFQSKDREISCLTMGLRKSTVAKIKAKIKEFKKEVVALVDDDETVEDVVQFNFQLFPLTRDSGDNDEKK